MQQNVLGQELLPCSLDPVTGFYRTGCCENHGDDPGMNVVCCRVTEEFLRDDLIPGTTGQLSFHARVAANVVAIVARELAAEPGQTAKRADALAPLGVASESAFAAAISSGGVDNRWAEVHDVLASGVAAKVAVANPRYLTNP